MTDKTNLLQVGQTYTDRAGNRWECIYVSEICAWCKGPAGDATAYVWTRTGKPVGLSTRPDEYTINLATPMTVDPILWEMLPDVLAITRNKNGAINAWTSPDLDPMECGDWAGSHGQRLTLNPLDLIDPGTCDWRKAIVTRPEGA